MVQIVKTNSDVIVGGGIRGLTGSYARVAGYDKETLGSPGKA